ncbi:MlaD family protein [Aeromicrobium sp. CTD01-1L150]|uniref:MlaD family protein n=1 Tax=Aeromicrobium sp. CTD01-1L150 TaxID=3341830 RepID=UPI0035C255F4
MSAGTRRTRRPQLSSLNLGLAFVLISLLAAVALFEKQAILTTLRSGETITVQFDEAHRLRDAVSEAKIAGVGIGVVKDVRQDDDGLTEVRLKVDRESLDAMGTTPSAAIRPTTLLGGNYYVEIKPGGRRGTFSGTIPTQRTQLPVEMDAVAAALPEDARQGVRSSVSDLDGALDAEGSRALRDLVTEAPDTLEPMAGALDALQGTRPDSDLRTAVDGLESTSRILSAKQGQLDGIVKDLGRVSAVLSTRRDDMATATARLPGTLDDADTMLTSLDGTLDQLHETAGPARPAVQELDEVLEDLDPVVEKARPVVTDLKGVLEDARPAVEDLVPTSRNLTGTFDDLDGAVLDRVNGPIMSTVLSPWHGEGRYEGGGADRPFYQELAYMASNLAQANLADENGSAVSFFPGVGAGSVAGLPVSLEQFFQQIASPNGAQR